MKVLDATLSTPGANLACDEALLDAAEAGESGEVLRFWESPETFVVVGYANRIAAEVNMAACDASSVPVLRRCSGGGTVVQGKGCLNYALILRVKEGGPTETISSANKFIMERNRDAIASVLPSNANVSVRGHTDLAIGAVKFSGNSQRRRKHHLLFHGTFLLSFDLALVTKLLRMPSVEPDYREHRAHEEFITNLNVPSETVKAAMCRIWEAKREAHSPTERLKQLVFERYSKLEWNAKF